MKIFVDSDVVLSSLLSSSGAAHLLINNQNLDLVVSNKSIRELEKGIQKLNISQRELLNLIKYKLKSVKLNKSVMQLKEDCSDYVNDINDAHIVAGAKAAKAQFLISYNIKDYKRDKIKQELGIIVTTPANLLQYLRGQD